MSHYAPQQVNRAPSVAGSITRKAVGRKPVQGQQQIAVQQQQQHHPSQVSSPVASRPGITQAQSYDSRRSSIWSETTSPFSTTSYQTGLTSPQLSRVPTTASATGHNVAPTLTRSGSVSSTGTSHVNLPTCDQCRATILPNIAIYHCLICCTGEQKTVFCLYCFTSGKAGTNHQHDQTFFGTKTDPAFEPSQETGTAHIPSHAWAIHKNHAGKMWFQHRATGYMTHVKPLTAVIPPPKAAAGWEKRTTPDGKVYFFNPKTGVSSWTLPKVASSLPTGWREARTPDGVAFYLHDQLQLACWERPGEVPGKRTAIASAGVKSVANAGKPVAAKSTKADAAALAEAADLSPVGILNASIAAVRLTTHGAKFAGKKMSKMAKSKNIRRMSRAFGSAAALATIADGGDFEMGDEAGDYEESGECETYEDDATVCESSYEPNAGAQMQECEPVPYQQDYFGSQAAVNGGYAEQSGYEQPVQADYAQDMYVQPAQEPYVQPVQESYVQPVQEPYVQPAQEPSAQSAQETYVQPVQEPCVQPNQEPYVQPVQDPYAQSVQDPYVQPAQEPYVPPAQPQAPLFPVCQPFATYTPGYEDPAYFEQPSSMYAETAIQEQTTTEQTMYTETSIQTEVATAAQGTASMEQTLSQEVAVTQTTTTVVETSTYVAAEQVTAAGATELPVSSQPVNGVQDGSVPPLVFEPVLAGPMMVEPPANSNGVVFAPNCAELI